MKRSRLFIAHISVVPQPGPASFLVLHIDAGVLLAVSDASGAWPLGCALKVSTAQIPRKVQCRTGLEAPSSATTLGCQLRNREALVAAGLSRRHGNTPTTRPAAPPPSRLEKIFHEPACPLDKWSSLRDNAFFGNLSPSISAPHIWRPIDTSTSPSMDIMPKSRALRSTRRTRGDGVLFL